MAPVKKLLFKVKAIIGFKFCKESAGSQVLAYCLPQTADGVLRKLHCLKYEEPSKERRVMLATYFVMYCLAIQSHRSTQMCKICGTEVHRMVFILIFCPVLVTAASGSTTDSCVVFIHLNLVPRLRMYVAIPPLLHMFHVMVHS